MTRDELQALTKADLAALARSAEIVGRSRMSKADLVDALVEHAKEETAAQEDVPDGIGPIQLPGISPEDRAEAKARRESLDARLAGFVDQSTHCPWRSIEGHPCGLPVVAGFDRCGPTHRDARVRSLAQFVATSHACHL